MCARTGWGLSSFLYLTNYPIIKDGDFLLSLSRQGPNLSFPLTYAFSAQLCEDSPFTAPCLHDAQQLTSFLLHTHCFSNYSWVVEEWIGEQKIFISWSVFSNWKIHTKYLVSHRRILCRLVELHIRCEINLRSRREGFKRPLKNTDVPPARLVSLGSLAADRKHMFLSISRK